MFKKSFAIDDSQWVMQDIKEALRMTAFHDVTIVVAEKTFTANKYFLSSRSMYFSQILEQSPATEVFTLDDLSGDFFGQLLEYLYTGKIEMTNNRDNVFQLILGAHKLKLWLLSRLLIEHLESHLLTLDSIANTYLISHSLRIQGLMDSCLRYMDYYSLDVVNSQGFWDLPLEPLRDVLNRSTFFAPEITLLRGILNWLSNHPTADAKELLECIRTKYLTGKCLDVVRNYFGTDSSKMDECGQKYRECYARGKNLALDSYGAKLIHVLLLSTTTQETEMIEYNESKDRVQFRKGTLLKQMVEKYDKCEILLELGVLTQINHIALYLRCDGPSNFYSSGEFAFIVHVSRDQKCWTTVADRRDDCGQFWQTIYFSSVMAKYIRITGYDWSPFNASNTHFFWSWMLFLHDFFTPKAHICAFNTGAKLDAVLSIPKAKNNVACVERGVVVYCNGEKILPSLVFDDNVYPQGKFEPMLLKKGQFLDVVLPQTYFLDSLGFTLGNKEDKARYDYNVHVWSSHEEIYFDLRKVDFNSKHPPKSLNWKQVAHVAHAQGGWQEIRFTNQRVAVASIQCVNALNKPFEIHHFEMPTKLKK